MKVGLKTKVTLVSVAILLVTIGAMAFVTAYTFRSDYVTVLQSKSLAVGRGLRIQLDRRIKLGIPLADITGFEEQLQQAMAQDGDIGYALVADPNGNVLFHHDRIRHDESSGARVAAAMRLGEESVLVSEGRDGRTYYAIVPVRGTDGDHIASIRIGFPAKVVEDKTRELYGTSAFVALASFFLSALCLYAAMGAWVDRPINLLLSTIRRIRRQGGDLTDRVGILTTDEIGELGAAFNDMMDDLQRTTVSRELLRESEENYRSVVEQSLAGIFVAQDGIIRFVNDRICEMTGYDRAGIVGRMRAIDFTCPEDKPLVEALMQRRASGGDVTGEYELRCIRKDGSVFPIKVYLKTAAFRGYRSTIATMLDVSREKQLERELLESQKVEAIGRLAGGIAHDINNYLVVITGSCELVKMRYRDDPDIQQNMAAAVDVSFKAGSLVKQLLAYGQRQPATPVVVALGEVVERIGSALRGLLPDGIRLVVEAEKTPWRVLIDPQQIEQILGNLIVNARVAMPAGGEIRVSVRNEIGSALAGKLPSADDDDKYVALEVSDTGEGIPEEIRDKIFDPYFTTGRRDGNAGLGLATVYGIVKQNNGHISVESEIGRGTTFRIYLPACDMETMPTVPTEGGEADSGIEATTRWKILLADDNKELVGAIRAYLDVFGYPVRTASDGEEALRVFEECGGDFDILITDVVMPRMNGQELARRILALKPGIKILFMSGYTDELIDKKGLMDSRTIFLQKPFPSSVLLAKIRELMGEKHLSGSLS